MAPEFYNNWGYHMSWTKVLYDFIMDDSVGPQSRVNRSFEDHKKGRKMITTNWEQVMGEKRKTKEE